MEQQKQSMNIQWYPGHMTKTRRIMEEDLKLVDAVCEILDARIPISSRNPDIDTICGSKPRMIILNRIDMADPALTKKWAEHFRAKGYAVLQTDCKTKKGISGFVPAVRELLADSTFPGMKVLQFAFGGGDNEYLPHNYVKNSVVYPGTHDNTTLTDWWENAATGKEKANAAAYLHLTPCKPTAKEVAAVKPDANAVRSVNAALAAEFARVTNPAKK